MNLLHAPPPPAFHEAANQLDLSLTTEHIRHLDEYLYLLLEKNKKINLTSIRDPEKAWMRHIVDSLTLLPCLKDHERLIDIGSGGGLPGVPIAIVKPDIRISLLESTKKKAGFLEDIVKKLNLMNVRTIAERAETVGHEPAHRNQYDVAASRAVGSLPEILELALPLVRLNGSILAMRGTHAEQEAKESRNALNLLGGHILKIDSFAVEPGRNNTIIEIQKIAHTPEKFPRAKGMPKKKPL